MKIIKTFKETYSDGPGIRYSIYVSGCSHKCDGCHNPESWDFNQGEELTEELIAKIKKEILSNPMLDGITISGGDPMHPQNAKGLLRLLESFKDLDKNVWVYTGYTFEEICTSNNGFQYEALRFIDVLVDGKFDKNNKVFDKFKGSKNQNFVKTRELMGRKK